jgi:hypothetical protein
MEGGNEATSGSGITQFAEGEPKKRLTKIKESVCWKKRKQY